MHHLGYHVIPNDKNMKWKVRTKVQHEICINLRYLLKNNKKQILYDNLYKNQKKSSWAERIHKKRRIQPRTTRTQHTVGSVGKRICGGKMLVKTLTSGMIVALDAWRAYLANVSIVVHLRNVAPLLHDRCALRCDGRWCFVNRAFPENEMIIWFSLLLFFLLPSWQYK